MPESAAVTVFLFSDIEGSTRLWEQAPDRMHDALARHDAIAAQCVTARRGRVVKSTGDGIHAVFHDPLDAVTATLDFLLALADPQATAGIELKVRCGLHAGSDARRDNDFFGPAVNRAARVMSVAHGGQILVSHAVASLVRDRLPDGVALRELGTVRLRDLARPESVFQVDHPALRQQFPALRSLEATPNNLPQQLTSFIGREHELGEVRRQLGHARLLTIFGIGGLGKSRLSVQVASDMLDDFPDGAWFVELAPVSDPRLVPQMVASVLGVKEEANQHVIEAVAKFVHDRRLLVVLDNCEHVTQACAELARKLLESGPHVTILATSRERLGIAGEKTYPLAPFPVPAARQHLAPDALAQFAAVRLFAERASAAHPDFIVTPGNAAAVADICHRLDGIPLAIELAAARVRAMSVDKIAERLTDRFKLLSGGDRTALPRQQTLRALIDWSYDLLSEAERTLLARLSVFAGGFTLEAAEKVGADEVIAGAEVLDLVTQLVEKSLVTVDVERDRYGMLETVRQYAQERLEATGDGLATRKRHIACYIEFGETGAPRLMGTTPGPWLARFDQEQENLQAAHAWCDRVPDGGAMGLQLVRAMRRYYLIRGSLELIYRCTLEALARPGTGARDIARSRGLTDAGLFALKLGEHRHALQHLEESLAIARELDDRQRIAIVLQPLGRAYLAIGDSKAAAAHLDEALALAKDQGDKREIAAALSNLEQLYRIEGNLDAAESMSNGVLELARELGDRETTGIALVNLAMTAILRGRADAAEAMLRDIVGINSEIGAAGIGQGLLQVAAGLAALRGDAARAARFHGAELASARLTGLHPDPADKAFIAAQADKARSVMGAQAFATAVAEGERLPYDQAADEVSAWLDSGR